MEKYEHKKVENKIQLKWKDSDVYKTDLDNEKKDKFYVLDMWPYPSGEGMHMGHTEVYTISDTYYRYKRMQGFNVLHPQGFDGFGLPAENFAIKTGTHPEQTTEKNSENYLRQWNDLGMGHDFSKLVYSNKPETYKWTQWIFGKFFENDLAYKKTAKANWCSSCQTIIANEQIEGGKCERCKTEIEQKDIPSWMFRITEFADELIWKKDEIDFSVKVVKKDLNFKGKEIKNTYFVNTEGKDSETDFKEGVETFERVVPFAIVKNKKTNQILCLDWKKTGWKALPAGGVEEDEDILESVKREVLEETGYKNIKFIKKIGEPFFQRFFRPHKGSNVFSKHEIFYFELLDEEKNVVNKEELEKHKAVWIDESKVKNYLTASGPQITWDFYLKDQEPDWPEHTKKNQNAWIGKSEGAKIKFDTKIVNNDKKRTVVLIHGFEGAGDQGWFKEIGSFFKEKGYDVLSPTFPNSNKPVYVEWKNFFEKNILPKINKESIIVGHSLGPTFLMKYLSESELKIKQAFFVAPAVKENKEIKEIDSEFYKDFNFKKIRNSVDDIKILFSDNDPYIPFEDFDYLSRELNVGYGQFPKLSHLSQNEENIPQLLNTIKTYVENIEDKVEIFTTRPDTLFGATYIVLAPEHELVQKWKDKIENWNEVEKYLDDVKKKTELERLEGKEKTGVELKGVKAINSANKEEIPIFISDYVLAGYGTGAIMAVPAHDERDNEFAKKFGIEINQVIECENSPCSEKGILVNSGEFDGMESEEAKKKITEFVGGEMTSTYRLRDWSISRQRYWGTPIPIVYNKEEQEKANKAIELSFYDQSTWNRLIKGEKKVETRALGNSKGFEKTKVGEYLKAINKETGEEVFLKIKKIDLFKNLEEFMFSGDIIEKTYASNKPANTIEKIKEDYNYEDGYVDKIQKNGLIAWEVEIIKNPGVKFVGEENLPWTLPTDVDFVPTGEAPLAKSKELKERVERVFGKGWTPEVDTMDTFVDSSWYFLRYTDSENSEEFASQKRIKKWMPVDLYIGGAEHTYMHLLFARFFTHAMNKIGLIDFKEPFLKLRHQGMVNDASGKKMSKSKGNVVNPDEMVERFGADATRAYMLFASPIEDDVMWNEDNIVGIYRWIEKIWRQREKMTENENIEFKKQLHKIIKSVTEHMEKLRYNVAIADMMKLMNFTDKEKEINKDDFLEFIKIASPLIPHVADEILGEFNIEKDWPVFNKDLVKVEKVKIGIQVNGKRRSEIEVSLDWKSDKVQEEVLKLEEVQKWVDGKKIKKFIYVKGRVISVIV